MYSFEIEQTVLLLNTEKKEKVNIYTMVNLTKNETQTLVGLKGDFPLHKPLIATISIKGNREVFELADGSKKYVNTSNFFITEIKEMNK